MGSYFANQIVECKLDESEVNANITHHIIDFADHRKNSKALSDTEAYLTIRGKKIQKRTTKGWRLCAELSNGNTKWMELKVTKEASPLKAARYAVANKISGEPAFRWWVPYVLEKEERIIIKNTEKVAGNIGKNTTWKILVTYVNHVIKYYQYLVQMTI